MDSTTLPMPPEIKQFLEGLLEEAKIIPTKPELKEMMMEDLYQRLQVRIMQVLAENLEAKDLETYSQLAAENQLKALEFVRSKKNNMPELMLKAMAEFRQIFLA